jgi:hypothetical protein
MRDRLSERYLLLPFLGRDDDWREHFVVESGDTGPIWPSSDLHQIFDVVTAKTAAVFLSRIKDLFLILHFHSTNSLMLLFTKPDRRSTFP